MFLSWIVSSLLDVSCGILAYLYINNWIFPVNAAAFAFDLTSSSTLDLVTLAFLQVDLPNLASPPCYKFCIGGFETVIM
jgi:hypothetical protein